jgi:hypothetical protein
MGLESHSSFLILSLGMNDDSQIGKEVLFCQNLLNPLLQMFDIEIYALKK